MKNFIKQNWFKLGILIILGSAVFVFAQNHAATPVPVILSESPVPITEGASRIVPNEIPTSTNEIPTQASATKTLNSAKVAEVVPIIKKKSHTSTSESLDKPLPILPAQQSWHKAFTFTGESSTASAQFSLKGAHWRVSFTCTATGNYAGVLVMIMGSNTDTMGQNESFGSGFDDCPPSHVYDFYNHTPGLYNFNTSDKNATYSATIEDYY